MNSNPCRSSTFPRIADRGQKSSEDLPITQFPVPCIPSAVNGLLKVEGERERSVKSEKKREGGRERGREREGGRAGREGGREREGVAHYELFESPTNNSILKLISQLFLLTNDKIPSYQR